MTDTRTAPDFDYETAASRASAFVYGNILVLAAMTALTPERAAGLTGVGIVLGTGLSTLVAHLVGEAVGEQIREGKEPSWSRLGRHMRNSAPIASSAAIPATLLAVGWLGWLPAAPALAAAQAVTIGRVGLLGAVIGHYHGERSVRAIISGLVLALVCAVAAALKWVLTH
ncbi:hypothetical protein [Mycolicibacterium thermoresistibile]